jgi:ketosteroid isomerase-like protein
MSQENVEIMRTNFEAWNAGNMHAVRESFDPDAIMRTPEGWPEPGPYMGREAVMRQLEQNRATWDADTFEAISDFIDAADRVVVRMIWHGVGQGPESNMEFTHIYTLRQGKVVFMEYFWDHAEALETLGLSE